MADSERDFDVIVVGGGGAGLAAATTAASEGARVLIVDADKKLGGSTSLSTGVFYAAGVNYREHVTEMARIGAVPASNAAVSVGAARGFRKEGVWCMAEPRGAGFTE